MAQCVMFWSSVDLTGNQTEPRVLAHSKLFWSSVDLTGNQTCNSAECRLTCFGAVSI